MIHSFKMSIWKLFKHVHHSKRWMQIMQTFLPIINNKKKAKVGRSIHFEGYVFVRVP